MEIVFRINATVLYTLCIGILPSYSYAIFHENIDIDLHHFMDPDEVEEFKTESD